MVEPRRLVTIPSVARSVSLLTVLSLLLALLLPAGLTLAQDDEDDADNAATPAASGDSPAGEYTVAITEDDIPQDVPGGADLIGRWQIFLEPDGAYSLGRADIGIVVTGSYTVDGETMTITDEDGLLSCVNAIPTAGPENPVETATYTWELDNGGLTLTPILEGCQGRGIIFSTRPLGFFVACNTTAVVLSTGAADATPAATPAAEDDEEDAEATPELDEDTIPVIDNPFGGDDDEDEGDDEDADENNGSDDAGQDSSDISDEEAEEGIDSLLRQLSACWATQDPARIIPLFGADFLEALLDEAGSLQDVAGIFGQIMVVPINWERSGEVESDGDTFSAIVALTIGGEESFQRYSFVFEDGQWLLDSFGF
jgi:hypothetical protein